jgi:predicted MFS family arabinose efflux permease
VRRIFLVRRTFYVNRLMTPGVVTAPRLRVQIVAATLARVIVNTAHRMIYPFLPAISRGLGAPLDELTVMLSVRSALGMTSPFFGVIPDRFGRRQAMLVGLGIFCVGLALVGWRPTYLTLYAAVILVVVSKFIFDPALQAYLGDRVPYARRGLVIAFTELGWSGAALVGIPLVGLLIARGAWHTPFWPLAALGLGALFLMGWIIPREPHSAGPTGASRRNHWELVWRNPVVLAAMSIGLFTSTANEILNVVYGSWMEQSFGLSVAALGVSTTVIGVAELAGEGLVMSLADRLGKRRAIALGLAASAAAYASLPGLAFNLAFALAGLFLVFIAFEFTIVASIPLMTELVPEARGTVMSASVAAHAAGRMLGALLGGWLFRFGFGWTGFTAAALNVVTLVIVVGWVKERRTR